MSCCGLGSFEDYIMESAGLKQNKGIKVLKHTIKCTSLSIPVCRESILFCK